MTMIHKRFAPLNMVNCISILTKYMLNSSMVEFWWCLNFGNQSGMAVLYDMIAIAFDKLRNIPNRKSYPSWIDSTCSQYCKTFDIWIIEDCDVVSRLYVIYVYCIHVYDTITFLSTSDCLLLCNWIKAGIFVSKHQCNNGYCWLMVDFCIFKSKIQKKWTNNEKDWIRSAHSKRHRYIWFWTRLK